GFADGGAYALRVTATDSAGASAAGEFTLSIVEAEPPPDPGDDGHHGHHDHGDDDDHHHDHGKGHEHGHDKRDRHDERERDCAHLFDRLEQPAHYDFSLLARELERRKPQETLSPEEIRRSWERVARFVATLGSGEEDLAHGASAAGDLLRLAPGGGHGFGYEASIGTGHEQKGFTPFEGLREGFRRL
ncbi:MAG: hypothetical protein WCA17_15025, partial [Burkholderiales bacterium]